MKTGKKITKVVSGIVALALLAGAIAGCGNNVTDKTEDGRTILKVGGYPTTNDETKVRFDEKIADFEAANPDVKIQAETWKFDLQSFYAKASGGQLPTLYDTNFTELEQCIKGNYSADISEALAKRGYDNMINPKVLEVVTEDGKIYGLPTDAYLLGIACNIGMFEKAGLMEADGTPMQPKDWNELIEFAKKIKEATGEAGFALPSMNNYGGWLLTPLMWSYGVDFMEQDENGKWIAKFNSPEAVEALELLKAMKWEHDILPENTLIDDPEQSKLLAGDKVGMVLSLASNVGNYSKYGMDPNNIGYLAFPAGPAKNVTMLGGRVMQIDTKATPEQQDAALRWIETTVSYKITDAYKKTVADQIASKIENNMLIGINNFSIWSDNAETRKYQEEQIKANANININHVKRYNDYIANCPAEIQAEEPVCAQELYATIDLCIQQVLTNENADCQAILDKAVSDFQSNYLDNV